MSVSHNLGFPRIGVNRELKHAVERYWKEQIDATELEQCGRDLRERHWRQQAESGLDFVPAGDFSWYDHVLDTSMMLGVIPQRFADSANQESVASDLDTYFCMARGRAPSGQATMACEMTKWFDSNYHYIVPEFVKNQSFYLAHEKLFEEVAEAQALGHKVKPVLLGPVSYLWLGKCKGDEFDRLSFLDSVLAVYGEILSKLKRLGIEWVQIDEPVLVLDLPSEWKKAIESSYNRLQVRGLNILLATYFGSLGSNLHLACNLPIAGLHVDAVRGRDQLNSVVDHLPKYKVLSVGVIDGRNIWRSDLDDIIAVLNPIKERFKERLWLAPSCSLLHVPVDLDQEFKIDTELKSWLAFARQKLDELNILKHVFTAEQDSVHDCMQVLKHTRSIIQSRSSSTRIHRAEVIDRQNMIDRAMYKRHGDYERRSHKQREALRLPNYPTTTIGSFPQTVEIRRARHAFKSGAMLQHDYEKQMKQEIAETVRQQEELGLDVLVHGEPERNDMVEYFSEQLDGYAFTDNGWVQSYGSRCVKPPIIYGDVKRKGDMTVRWASYAQSLSEKPMKGMLTGPVTMLQWSFVRDDQPRAKTCQQIALALRDEVLALEQAGIPVIQIDEPAFREGLPLKRSEWESYLKWAVDAFRLSSAGVKDETQIHTHMCYAEFNDIIEAIAQLDADVITIETSRSDMELLDAFADFSYPNEIGPGVYDIHSPNVPTIEQMVILLRRAADCIPAQRLWVNPDCGLKTRGWPEVKAGLSNMVAAAHQLRLA
ncbi:MAG: 5-methyltetrahydropteroyltriglutamate--homocysteine S-methyltransferase [Gammaproteobacteria bacterium]|nr:MAG: 5-methyltetrahydropteroyltriglutamate--homocysteine S-methyltransferase [Gammaproteobacteria bacterium]